MKNQNPKRNQGTQRIRKLPQKSSLRQKLHPYRVEHPDAMFSYILAVILEAGDEAGWLDGILSHDKVLFYGTRVGLWNSYIGLLTKTQYSIEKFQLHLLDVGTAAGLSKQDW